MGKKILIIALINCMSFVTFSQNKDAIKETFEEAEYYILYEDYQEALALYIKLQNEGLDNAYINHRIGECYLQIPGKKENSIPYLEKACENLSEEIKEGSIKEDKAPFRTLFYLASAYQINNELDKAIETFKKFQLLASSNKDYNIDYIDQQIRSCQNAKELIAHPLNIRKTNLGNKINDEFSNLNAVVSSDEKSIIYISKLKFYDAIFYSIKSGYEWNTPVNITPDIQSDGDYYPCYLSQYNNILILFRYDNFNGDIYTSDFKDDKWQLPKKLNKHINSKFFETHATLSSDGNTLFFVSNRKDGYGGFDIYKSTFDENNNEWGVAVNLGPEINTPLDEETPQLSEDGKTLYFSSQGHYNMGGFDIFYSHLIDTNHWSTPVNIGYPINTTDDDIFFYPVKNGQFAYLSTIDEDGYGQQDIYRIEFFTPDHPFLINVKGRVALKDNQTEFPKNKFHIDILDSSKTEFRKIYLNENTGEFNTELSPGSYQFIFKSDDYKQNEKNVIIPKNYNRKELGINVELVPLEVTTGEYVTIKSIYFGFDDYSLSKESKIELEKLYHLMAKYPSLQIEVVGHTDSKGSVEYNKKLSLKRAQSAINYLTNKGVDKSRFVAKGAGTNQPVAININADGSDNPEGRKYNRRVEIKILKSNDKIILTEDYNIPKRLISKHLDYCILITKQKKQLPENYFDQYEELKEYKIKEYKNSEFIYTVGSCQNKSELIKIFSIVLELGFEDAQIISNYDLKNMLH